MHISSYYYCSFCAVYMQFICSVFYEIMKCYMQTTILHIHSTEVRPKAKNQVKPKPNKNNKNQKPKAKSQVKPKPKAKRQKPNGHAKWLKTASNSTQIRDFGSKMQQIQARSQKPKEPEAKSQKPEARSQKPKKQMPPPQKKCPKKYPSLIRGQHYIYINNYIVI